MEIFSIEQLAEWLRRNPPGRSIRLIQNHHTWRPSYSAFNGRNHAALCRGMRNYHRSRGFAEIAQHFTTFADGLIATGRPLSQNPAGIKGANTGAICIEHLGNFDIGQDLMTPSHRECIIALNTLLCRRFSLLPSSQSIVYHHWYDQGTGRRTDGAGSTKSCPGTGFFGGNSVAQAERSLIAEVSRRLAL